MGKVKLLFLLVCIVLINIGQYLKIDNPVIFLASLSDIYIYIRSGLIFILIALMLTDPPRHKWLRNISGLSAIATASLAIIGIFNYSVQPTDALILISYSFIVGTTALELHDNSKSHLRKAKYNLKKYT